MDFLTVYNQSQAAALLSSDGLTTTLSAQKVVDAIKEAAKLKGVYITFWNNQTVTFLSVYMHTVKVPTKALKSLESFKEWTIERLEHFFILDGYKIGIYPKY